MRPVLAVVGKNINIAAVDKPAPGLSAPNGPIRPERTPPRAGPFGTILSDTRKYRK